MARGIDGEVCLIAASTGAETLQASEATADPSIALQESNNTLLTRRCGRTACGVECAVVLTPAGDVVDEGIKPILIAEDAIDPPLLCGGGYWMPLYNK